MDQQPLHELFEAMYLGKQKFEDFAECALPELFERRQHDRIRKEISWAGEKLRVYHEFVRLFILDFLPINEKVVFSYRKRTNAYDAVAHHAKSRHFFVTDIEQFFPSIQRSRIESTIRAGAPLTPVSDLEFWIPRILDLVCVDGKLPVGFSTSPVLSNCVLLHFDDQLHKYCVGRDLVYTRYADDIIISSQNPEALYSLREEVASMLNRCMDGELRLHAGKSKLMHIGTNIQLLGMTLFPDGTISVDRSLKTEIEVLLHLYIHNKAGFSARAKIGAPDKIGAGKSNSEARLAGMLNHVNTVDRAYLDKLRRKYGSTVVDMFIHRSFG